MWSKTSARSMLLNEAGGQIDRLGDVLPLPRLEGVVAGDPGDLDRRRERVAGDVGARPERIALALDDERWRPQRAEVRRPQLLRLSRRMERVAEADEGADTQLVRDHAGHPPAERFAADGDGLAAAVLRDDVAPRLQQHRLAIGHAAPRGHGRELEGDDADAAPLQSARDGSHERRIHAGAGAVSEEKGHFRTACTSISIFTAFPTRIPPVSRAWFHLRPHSRRSISPVARAPARVPPHGSVPIPSYVQSSVTSSVVPRIVRSPMTLKRSPSFVPAPSTRLLRNAIVGWCSASRKSADLRCASRSATPVSMLAAAISTCTEELDGLASSARIVPFTSLKRPRTVVNIMCFTANSTVVWFGSISHVVGMSRSFYNARHAPHDCTALVVVGDCACIRRAQAAARARRD